MNRAAVQKLTASALLIALGMLIPMFSPVKILLEPASFTLASHVAIFVAMVISPGVAALVTAGTTLGFFLSGVFPLVVTLRAASHIVFSLPGAFYLRRGYASAGALRLRVFSFLIGILHGLAEVAVVGAFYFGGSMGEAYYQNGFLFTVIGLVGIGTVVHSMVDFEIARLLLRPLEKQPGFRAMAGR
ncbi:MAG: hypothetical protein LBU86_06270 [Oscillospiraceae bacterium]|nr:hypothetical protein [Oscillospiraceae bacterium]